MNEMVSRDIVQPRTDVTAPVYATRILPPDEWPKLTGTEAECVWPTLDPSRTSIVVVERNGVIVGCHVLMWMLHAECLWIHPDARGRTSVPRRLWAGVQHVALSRWGVSALITAAIDDRVRRLLAHVGATRLPGEHYVVPLSGD